jgi:hypothetical protein
MIRREEEEREQVAAATVATGDNGGGLAVAQTDAATVTDEHPAEGTGDSDVASEHTAESRDEAAVPDPAAAHTGN